MPGSRSAGTCPGSAVGGMVSGLPLGRRRSHSWGCRPPDALHIRRLSGGRIPSGPIGTTPTVPLNCVLARGFSGRCCLQSLTTSRSSVRSRQRPLAADLRAPPRSTQGARLYGCRLVTLDKARRRPAKPGLEHVGRSEARPCHEKQVHDGHRKWPDRDRCHRHDHLGRRTRAPSTATTRMPAARAMARRTTANGRAATRPAPTRTMCKGRRRRSATRRKYGRSAARP